MAQAGVHLRVVDTGNVRAACKLEMEPGQHRFVAPVAVSLAEAYVQPDVAWPRLIYDGESMVGFVMAEFDKTEGEYYLWRLNIAAGHQRNGYGTFAVSEVARESKRRGATTLLTSYVPGEGTPQGFYERLGFIPTGAVDEGEIVMSKSLDDLEV